MRRELTQFRETVLAGVRYMDDEYRVALGAYQRARTDFLATARGELT